MYRPAGDPEERRRVFGGLLLDAEKARLRSPGATPFDATVLEGGALDARAWSGRGHRPQAERRRRVRQAEEGS